MVGERGAQLSGGQKHGHRKCRSGTRGPGKGITKTVDSKLCTDLKRENFKK